MAKELELQPERTTLQAIAERSGVSTTTVSLVLSGKSGTRRIAEATREKVWKVAEELNYAPNLLTRSLKRGRTHVISFFSAFRHYESDDLYMDKLAFAIEKAGGEYGYDILIHCNFKRTLKETYQFLNGGFADGLVVFAPTKDDPLLTLLRRSNLPVVVINSYHTNIDYASVSDDVELGIKLAVQKLLSAGHRKIGFFEDARPGSRDAQKRNRLLEAELNRAGIKVPKNWKPDVQEPITDAVDHILAQPDCPTALFCWHDRLAYDVVAYCELKGILIPNELSVVGYDGVRWPTGTRHSVSSVHVDLHELAKRAVCLLDRVLIGEALPNQHELLTVGFQDGTTLGPVPVMQ